MYNGSDGLTSPAMPPVPWCAARAMPSTWPWRPLTPAPSPIVLQPTHTSNHKHYGLPIQDDPKGFITRIDQSRYPRLVFTCTHSTLCDIDRISLPTCLLIPHDLSVLTFCHLDDEFLPRGRLLVLGALQLRTQAANSLLERLYGEKKNNVLHICSLRNSRPNAFTITWALALVKCSIHEKRGLTSFSSRSALVSAFC